MSDRQPNKKQKSESYNLIENSNQKPIRPIRNTLISLLGSNFQGANYATISILTMIAIVFMFQTDIIQFRNALNGLSEQQLVALTSALGGPINQAGISAENVEAYTRTMYVQLAQNMDIPVTNIGELVSALAERNTAIQQLIPAGWSFPAIYGQRTFSNVSGLVAQIMSDSSAPIYNVFTGIMENLRTSLGMPSMSNVISIINENSSNFVQNSPRLEPVRMYYFALLNLVNGDGNLFRDLQNIATITAFNQYANIYSGVFVALMVALRNSVSLASAMTRGIVRGTNGLMTFVIGEDLYTSILGEISSSTRSVVQAPFVGSFHVARFVIFQINRVINSVLEIDSPFDIFGGDPGHEIPENLVLMNHEPLQMSLTIDPNSEDEYNLLREIGDLTELYILSNPNFRSIIQQLVRNTNFHNIRDALEEVLVPEQNVDESSQLSSRMSMTSRTSRSSVTSIYYGDSSYRMTVFLQHMFSYIFTTSVFLSNPSQGANTLLTDLNQEVDQQEGIVVDELLDDRRVTNEIIGNVSQVVNQETNALELLQQYGSPSSSALSSALSSAQSTPQYNYDDMDVEFGGSRKRRKGRLDKRRTKKMKMNKKGKTKKMKRKSLKMKKIINKKGNKSKRRL